MQLYEKFNPLVSIILPTFNRVSLLKRAVDSVLAQTINQFELIIIDDGSTDDTFPLINSYVNKHNNFRYVKQQNMKLPIALNVGIRLAASKFITFLGSDDEYKPEHLEVRLKFMNSHPEVDLIHGGVEVIGDKFVKDKNNLKKLIPIEDCAVGGTFFGKQNVFRELNGFKNIFYSEDSEFLERAEKIFQIRKVNFKTYIYHRETPDSICNTV